MNTTVWVMAAINAGFSVLVGLALLAVRSMMARGKEAAEAARAESRQLECRLQDLAGELAEHKLKVAERYMTADAFVLVASELKNDIKDLRQLIIRSLERGDDGRS